MFNSVYREHENNYPLEKGNPVNRSLQDKVQEIVESTIAINVEWFRDTVVDIVNIKLDELMTEEVSPLVVQEPEWVNVYERLPDDDEQEVVLWCRASDSKIFAGYRMDDEVHSADGEYIGEVDEMEFWRPAPEVPQIEELQPEVKWRTPLEGFPANEERVFIEYMTYSGVMSAPATWNGYVWTLADGRQFSGMRILRWRPEPQVERKTETEWISVHDRLPAPWKDVHLAVKDHVAGTATVLTAYRSTNSEYMWAEILSEHLIMAPQYEVTHWRELHSLPEEYSNRRTSSEHRLSRKVRGLVN